MKINTLILTLATLCGTLSLHAEKVAAGPKGGRLLDAEPLKAEFFVTPERKVEITFYDTALKPVDPGAQVAVVTIEPAGGKMKLELAKTPTGFVSTASLPDGEPYRVVVQVRASADAKPKNFRVDLNLGNCAGCQKAEYACVCESH